MAILGHFQTHSYRKQGKNPAVKASHSPGRKPGREKDPRRRDQALAAEQVVGKDLGGADRRKDGAGTVEGGYFRWLPV